MKNKEMIDILLSTIPVEDEQKREYLVMEMIVYNSFLDNERHIPVTNELIHVGNEMKVEIMKNYKLEIEHFNYSRRLVAELMHSHDLRGYLPQRGRWDLH